MLRVVVLGELRKRKIADAGPAILSWLKARTDAEFLDFADGVESVEADLIIVLGGDGAILRAARTFAASAIPLLGINLGKFGFLAELTTPGFEPALEKALSGEFNVSRRMMLRCRATRSDQAITDSVGLNDVVVSRSALSRLISVKLLIDREELTTYSADGLIISTPTGSTAHSLAAGGPILTPELEAFIVAPVCPHTLTNRPLVISGDRVLRLRIEDASDSVALTVDGQVYVPLEIGDEVIVERSPQCLHLVDAGVRTFYQTLHDKLRWGGQPNYGGR